MRIELLHLDDGLKDAFDADDVITHGDQGKMRLPEISGIIQALGERYRIVGADAIGAYSMPHYEGSLFTRLQKRAEMYLDQPHRRPDARHVADKNAAPNLAFLKIFQEAIA